MNPLKLFLICALLGTASVDALANTTLESLTQELTQNNPQLLALEEKVKAQEAVSRSTWGRFAPQLAANVGYGIEDTHEENNQGYLGYFSGTWNLFNGGQDFSSHSVARLEHEIARIEKEKVYRLLNRQLKEIFYALLAHKKTIDLLSDKSRFIEQQGLMAQKKINAGLTSAVDRIELDLTANSITLEKERLQSEIQQLTKDLESLLNKKLESLPIAGTEGFETSSFPAEADNLARSNPELLQQRYVEEIAMIRASQARADFLPEINLRANYGRITPEYGDPLNGTESQLFVILTWDLFSGFSKFHNLKAASHKSSSEQLHKAQKKLELKTLLQNLVTSRDNLLKLRGLQEQRLGLAKKYYDLTLAEYRRGVKNSGDLEMATTSLFSSRRKLIELDRDVSIVNAKIKELI